MEALIGARTVAQIAGDQSVHAVQVSQWQAVIRERLPGPETKIVTHD